MSKKPAKPSKPKGGVEVTPTTEQFEKARRIAYPYLGDFGDVGAFEQMVIDIAHALAEVKPGKGGKC